VAQALSSGPPDRRKAEPGGRRHRCPGLSRWLFSLPRWLVFRLIGGEPEIPLEDAIRYATETLDGLARLEDAILICGLSFRPGPTRGAAAEIFKRRVSTFQAPIVAHARRYHIIMYDRNDALRRAGGAREKSFYPDLATRQFEASLIVDLVIAGGHAQPRQA